MENKGEPPEESWLSTLIGSWKKAVLEANNKLVWTFELIITMVTDALLIVGAYWIIVLKNYFLPETSLFDKDSYSYIAIGIFDATFDIFTLCYVIAKTFHDFKKLLNSVKKNGSKAK